MSARPVPLPPQRLFGVNDIDDPFPRALKLYLISSYPRTGKPLMLMGCTRRLTTRLAWHNRARAPVLAKHGRQAAGYWRVLMFIVLPDARQLRARRLLEHWEKTATKKHRKITEGMRIARELKLPVFVEMAAIKADPALRNALKGFLATMEATKKHARVRSIRATLASLDEDTLAVARVDGLDFSKSVEFIIAPRIDATPTAAPNDVVIDTRALLQRVLALS